MLNRYDTLDVAGRDRFEYWADAVCESYVQLGCETDLPDAFEGSILLNRMEHLSTSTVRGSPQLVTRRKTDIARSLDDSFLLSLQVGKRCLVEQRGRVAVLNPGDMALYSSADPYSLDLTDDFTQLVFQIPRQDLLRQLPNADLLTAITVPGGTDVARVVGQSLLSVAKSCETQEGTVSLCLQNVIVDLIVTALASLNETEHQLRQPEQMLYLRANQLICSNFADPGLSRGAVARAAGVSVRRMSQIFRLNDSSISATIRSQRMTQIARRLADPGFARQSISEIALSCGMNNLQHFSRAFREQYDMTPTQYRRAARIGDTNGR